MAGLCRVSVSVERKHCIWNCFTTKHWPTRIKGFVETDCKLNVGYGETFRIVFVWRSTLIAFSPVCSRACTPAEISSLLEHQEPYRKCCVLLSLHVIEKYQSCLPKI